MPKLDLSLLQNNDSAPINSGLGLNFWFNGSKNSVKSDRFKKYKSSSLGKRVDFMSAIFSVSNSRKKGRVRQNWLLGIF